MLQQQEYLDYCKRFKRAESYLRSNSADFGVVAYNICKLREYYPERMSDTLIKAGFIYIEDTSDSVYEPLKSMGHDLGLFNKDGKFLLAGRFIFPVRDMLGNTVALIGWFPDERKYITTPSKLFSKSCMFYGLEELGEVGTGKDFFLVEGIFDRLALRSIGLNSLSEMGIESSRIKESLYPLFKSLVGIPDNDAQGKKVIDYDKWSLPINSRYFRWTGSAEKDIDRIVNAYEADDVREMLLSAFNSTENIVVESLG